MLPGAKEGRKSLSVSNAGAFKSISSQCNAPPWLLPPGVGEAPFESRLRNVMQTFESSLLDTLFPSSVWR